MQNYSCLFEHCRPSAARQLGQPMHSQSANFGKFKPNSHNLAGIILHHSVQPWWRVLMTSTQNFPNMSSEPPAWILDGSSAPSNSKFLTIVLREWHDIYTVPAPLLVGHWIGRIGWMKWQCSVWSLMLVRAAAESVEFTTDILSRMRFSALERLN